MCKTGCIIQSGLEKTEANPLINPSHNHVATLLVRYHHKEVKHHGRHFTEGVIPARGLWIIEAKRCISSVIHRCVSCQKLLERREEQQMADLPAEHLQTEPHFSFVGLDVFGPWEVTSRHTRGDQTKGGW